METESVTVAEAEEGSEGGEGNGRREGMVGWDKSGGCLLDLSEPSPSQREKS